MQVKFVPEANVYIKVLAQLLCLNSKCWIMNLIFVVIFLKTMPRQYVAIKNVRYKKDEFEQADETRSSNEHYNIC